MKQLLLLLVLALIISACARSAGLSRAGTFQAYLFFPYTAGDEYVWRVNDESNDTTYTRSWKVIEPMMLDSHLYQVHVSNAYLHPKTKADEGPAMRRDTFFYRVQSDSVFFTTGAEEVLAIDFTEIYKPGERAVWRFVKDTTNVVVPAGTFDGKIMQWDEAMHVYSPGVGMIYSRFVYGGFSPPIITELLSAKIGGRVYP